MEYGLTRIYSPDDGRVMGLQGMVDDMLMSADFPLEISMIFLRSKSHGTITGPWAGLYRLPRTGGEKYEGFSRAMPLGVRHTGAGNSESRHGRVG